MFVRYPSVKNRIQGGELYIRVSQSVFFLATEKRMKA